MNENPINISRLYEKGDPSDHCYLLSGGTVFLHFADLPAEAVEMKKALIGTVEFFASEPAQLVRPRMFGVSVEASSSLSKVSFETLSDTVQDFAFGVAANRFLAEIIDRTNALLTQQAKDLQFQRQRFDKLARNMAGVITQLEILASKKDLAAVKNLCARFNQSPTVQIGKSLLYDNIVTRLELAPEEHEKNVCVYEANGALCKKGDDASSMFVLLRGKIRVASHGKTIARIETPGEAFGELSLFMNNKRTAELTALEKSTVLVITKENLREFHEDHPLMFFQIARTLAKRVGMNLERIEQGILDRRDPERFAERAEEAARERITLVRDLREIERLTKERGLADLLFLLSE